MTKPLKISTGERYGRLAIQCEVEKKQKRRRRFQCLCDCGNIVCVNLEHLRSGKTKSCGCFQKENREVANLRHGLYGSPLYILWHSMKQRCENQKAKGYADYGGRGIKICQEWQEVSVFCKWASKKGFKQGLSIERIDVNGDYSPLNCTFIPKREQAKNTRKNRFITYKGETMIISDWAKRIGLSCGGLKSRLDLGWAVGRALTEQPHNRGGKKCLK